MPLRIISIIGGSESNDNTLRLAEDVGEEIAKRGVALACGGMKGIMEAACRGAKRHSGVTIGIIPTDDKLDANKYVDFAIPTGLGYARNFIVAKTGDAVIAIDGSAGTLSEIAIAWFSDKPIVALSSSGGWAEKLSGIQIDKRRDDMVYPAKTAQEALDIIFKILDWE